MGDVLQDSESRRIESKPDKAISALVVRRDHNAEHYAEVRMALGWLSLRASSVLFGKVLGGKRCGGRIVKT